MSDARVPPHSERGLLIRVWCRWRYILVPVLVLALLIFPSIFRGSGGMTDGFKADDTAWYSAIALRAFREHRLWTLPAPDAVDPSTNQPIPQPYFNKPPLAFWLHGLSLHLFGPHIAAARLPTILAALACVAVLSAMLAPWIGRDGACAAGLSLALTFEFLRHTQAISLDMWLALWCLAACAFALRAARSSAWWLMGSGVMIGLALMTKPLVGALLFLVIIVWLPLIAQRPIVPMLASLLAAALVALPWHLSQAASFGDTFTSQYFGREIGSRLSGTLGNFNTGAGPTFYLTHLAATYWPWLAIIIACVVSFCRAEFRPAHLAPPARLLAIAAVAWLVALTLFPDRRPRYLLPAYPMLAGLVGVWLIAAQGRGGHIARLVMHHVSRWAVPVAGVFGLSIGIASTLRAKEPDQWDLLISWLDVDSSRLPRIHEGALGGQRAAILYLARGQWPKPTRSAAGELVTPSSTATPLFVYHRRDGHQPMLLPCDSQEVIEFVNGDLTVTRLVGTRWSPIKKPDPGE